MKHSIFRVGIALALCSVAPATAHAQFGKLGDAVKKKAKEVGAQAIGKEEPKKEEATATSTPTSRPPTQMLITSEVLDNFSKGLNAASVRRTAYAKRKQCEQSSITSPEYMQIMAAQGEDMEKQLKDNMTDAQKNAVIMKIGEEMQKKQIAFVTKKCGPALESYGTFAEDSIGAATAGYTASQYSMLKERIIAYCDAVAHGSDTPSDRRLAFTDEEMAALKPRCAALSAQLKRNS
jgi:hypothetical protein